MVRSIPMKYLNLAYGADKLLQEIITEIYETVPFHENIEKNCTNRAVVVTKMVYKGKVEP